MSPAARHICVRKETHECFHTCAWAGKREKVRLWERVLLTYSPTPDCPVPSGRHWPFATGHVSATCRTPTNCARNSASTDQSRPTGRPSCQAVTSIGFGLGLGLCDDPNTCGRRMCGPAIANADASVEASAVATCCRSQLRCWRRCRSQRSVTQPPPGQGWATPCGRFELVCKAVMQHRTCSMGKFVVVILSFTLSISLPPLFSLKLSSQTS